VLALRSFLFNAFFFGTLGFWLVAMLPLLALPPRVPFEAIRLWARLALWGLKVICGLTFEVRGRERLPPRPVIAACKHQSTWETVALLQLFDRPVWAIKRELFRIPLWGWYAYKTRQIPIDRTGGGAMLRRLTRAVKENLEAGKTLVIFPEGTRTAPGTRRPYQRGIAALYAQGKVPLVPMALNSGLFWGRRSFLKYPGTVVVEFLPAIPPGRPAGEALKDLETAIEDAADRLAAEARARFPHLPPPAAAEAAKSPDPQAV